RQDSMKNWGDAMGVMGDMAKAPDTFDADVFKEQAAFLAEDASTPWSHFENQESMGNATEAVWTNPEGFTAEAEKFQQVTTDLNAAAQTAASMDDVKPAFGEVGATCKSCHTDFKAETN
ncbi:MAG: c-type cytochrome, partial [Moraxellaceae bacterium]